MGLNEWIIIGSIQGFLVMLFLWSKSENKLANRFLSFAILFSTLQCLAVANIESWIQLKYLNRLIFLSWINIIPVPICLYLYIRFLTIPDPKLRKKDFYHLISWIVALGFILPYWFMSPESRQHLLDLNNPVFIRKTLISEFFCSVVILFYVNLMLQRLAQYHEDIKDYYSTIKSKHSYWLYTLAFSSMLVGILGIFFSVYGLIADESRNLNVFDYRLALFSAFIPTTLIYFWLIYKALIQPELFSTNYKKWKLEKRLSLSSKYSNSRLGADESSSIAKNLNLYMSTEKPFLNKNLNLSMVAEALSISNQQLSQVLNQFYKKNFYDYINEYRLEVAKVKLTDIHSQHLTIQGIAEESGFKSKSTFYSVFKKYIGITPNAYKKQRISS